VYSTERRGRKMNRKQQTEFLDGEIKKYLESAVSEVKKGENGLILPERLEIANLRIPVELREEILPEVQEEFEKKQWKVEQVGTTVYFS